MQMLADVDTPADVSDYVLELRRMALDEPVRFLPLLAIMGDDPAKTEVERHSCSEIARRRQHGA